MATTIKAISRSKLDIESYDDCIHQSPQRRIYAYSWYLDAMSDDWYALVQGHYEAVMPLPFRKKWGLKYVYQPPMIQQLGVFGQGEINVKAFFKMAIDRHLHFDYIYHGPNHLEGGDEKLNLILSLESMDVMLSNISSNRKRDLKKAEKNNLQFQYLTASKFIELVANKLDSPDLPTLHQLESLLKQHKRYGDMQAIGVLLDDKIIFSLLIGVDESRVYYLFPFDVTEASKKCGAATFAIIKLIEQWNGQLRYLDFEGSMVPGVRRFYESFLAEPEHYYHIKKSVFHFIKHAR